MCPHRTFTDDDGRLWQAWDVIPSWGERRGEDRRKNDKGPPPGMNDRRIADRRRHRGIRIGLTSNLVHGWLAFEHQGERRRLVPIPDQWDQMGESALRDLWRTAEHLPPRRGRLIE